MGSMPTASDEGVHENSKQATLKNDERVSVSPHNFRHPGLSKARVQQRRLCMRANMTQVAPLTHAAAAAKHQAAFSATVEQLSANHEIARVVVCVATPPPSPDGVCVMPALRSWRRQTALRRRRLTRQTAGGGAAQRAPDRAVAAAASPTA